MHLAGESESWQRLEELEANCCPRTQGGPADVHPWMRAATGLFPELTVKAKSPLVYSLVTIMCCVSLTPCINLKAEKWGIYGTVLISLANTMHWKSITLTF